MEFLNLLIFIPLFQPINHPAVTLCWPAYSARSEFKAGASDGLQQCQGFRRRYILHKLNCQPGRHSLVCQLFYKIMSPYGRNPYLYNLPTLQLTRCLDTGTIYRYMPLGTRLSRQSPRLENPHSPQPLVNPYFFTFHIHIRPYRKTLSRILLFPSCLPPDNPYPPIFN